jgi:hypothetical protein
MCSHRLSAVCCCGTEQGDTLRARNQGSADDARAGGQQRWQSAGDRAVARAVPDRGRAGGGGVAAPLPSRAPRLQSDSSLHGRAERGPSAARGPRRQWRRRRRRRGGGGESFLRGHWVAVPKVLRARRVNRSRTRRCRAGTPRAGCPVATAPSRRDSGASRTWATAFGASAGATRSGGLSTAPRGWRSAGERSHRSRPSSTSTRQSCWVMRRAQGATRAAAGLTSTATWPQILPTRSRSVGWRRCSARDRRPSRARGARERCDALRCCDARCASQ